MLISFLHVNGDQGGNFLLHFNLDSYTTNVRRRTSTEIRVELEAVPAAQHRRQIADQEDRAHNIEGKAPIKKPVEPAAPAALVITILTTSWCPCMPAEQGRARHRHPVWRGFAGRQHRPSCSLPSLSPVGVSDATAFEGGGCSPDADAIRCVKRSKTPKYKYVRVHVRHSST